MSLRILHLISSNGIYGAEKVLLSLCSSMNVGEYESWVVVIKNAYNPHTEVIEEAKKIGLSVFIIDSKGRFDYNAIKTLANFIKNNGINIIHTHNYKANLIGLLAARKAKIPIIATLHGYIGKGIKLRLYESLDRFILRFFNQVVLVEKSKAKKFSYLKNRIKVIYNGVAASKENLPNIRKDTLTIGSLGRLSEEKGYHHLIEAFAQIYKSFPQTRLLLVGDGPLRQELLNLAIELGLKEVIEFTGYQKNINKYYSLIDIYVCSSLKENLPVSVLEAMSYSKAIIATKVGGIPELIQNDYFGLLVNSDNTDELFKAIERLIENEPLRKQLGKNAQQAVTERFSLKKMTESYLQLYEKILYDKK